MIKSIRIQWVGHVERIGEKINSYRLLVKSPEGKRPLGRPGHMWMDNIKLDLGKILWGGTDWIRPTQNRDKWKAIVNLVMKFRVPNPPIYITSVTNIPPLFQLLDQIVLQLYEIKALVQNQVTVQPKTPDSYRIITKALLDRNTQFHTFKPKEERTYRFVLKICTTLLI
jgi:hypothetical protein